MCTCFNNRLNFAQAFTHQLGNLLPGGRQETARTEAHKQNNKIVVWGYSSDSG